MARDVRERMTRFFQITIVVVTLLVCVGCDQGTKAVAKAYLPGSEAISYAWDSFRLQYAENPGSFLGLGSSLPDSVRRPLFSLGVGSVLFALLGYLLFGPVLPKASIVSLSLITGGGVSNLIDRIAYDGHVVDFLNLGLGTLRTGIFNFADVAIMAGCVILIVKSLGAREVRPD